MGLSRKEGEGGRRWDLLWGKVDSMVVYRMGYARLLVPPSRKHQDSKKEEEKKKPHIKKPLNAFMLYMKEMRAKVVAECTLKESAAINQILGRRVGGPSVGQNHKSGPEASCQVALFTSSSRAFPPSPATLNPCMASICQGHCASERHLG